MRGFIQVIFVCLATFSIPAYDAARAQGGPVEIAIGLSSSSIPVNTPRLADALGLFEKNGLKPRFIVADSGAGSMTALLAGSIDFAATGIDELLAVRSRGQQGVAILVNIYRGQSGAIIISNDLAARLPAKAGDSPAARLKALNGVTIAVPSATSSMLGTIRMSGAPVGVDVKFTYIAQTAMVSAMSAKSIDAYMASSPFSDQAIEAGVGVRWLSGPRGEFPEAATTNVSSALITSRAYAERNPDVLRKVRATFDELASLVRDRPDQVILALKKLYPDLKESVLKLSFEENSPNWTRPDLSEVDLRKEIDMRKGGGLPDLDKIDPRSLVIPR